jgi:hypothetical protein
MCRLHEADEAGEIIPDGTDWPKLVLPIIGTCPHLIDRDKFCYQCYLDRTVHGGELHDEPV